MPASGNVCSRPQVKERAVADRNADGVTREDLAVASLASGHLSRPHVDACDIFT